MQDLAHHVRIRLSTAEVVDGRALAQWMDDAIGTGRWACRMDVEKDWLSWSFSDPGDLMLFKPTWGYGLGS